MYFLKINVLFDLGRVGGPNMELYRPGPARIDMGEFSVYI